MKPVQLDRDLDDRAFAFYYGDGQLNRLAAHRRVVLQGDFYRLDQIGWLLRRGVQPLCYLTLTEDPGPPAPWQRTERNPDWGGAFVHVGHPGWVEHVLAAARSGLAKGFQGLFLDTLNIELTFPEELPALLALVAQLREETARGRAEPPYLLANRGFGLLPGLAELVDGVLFESFTARWTEDGYAEWPLDTLEVHAQYAERLLRLDLEVYALDYAPDQHGELAERARTRAHQFGMPCFLSDRAVGRL
jgi:polysaccharide biosynthesis protein PelA